MIVRKKIWIINREVNICLLLKVYYLRKNYEVYTSHDVPDALLRIEENIPDIILLNSITCKDLNRDIRLIKAAAPGAELIIDGTNELVKE